MSDILRRDGLSTDLLYRLSFKSDLGISLKKNLHYFDKNRLLEELIAVNTWYDQSSELSNLALDYRIKSIQSAIMKYERYYPDHQARKVFNDLLGFRSLVDDYMDILSLEGKDGFRVADLTKGKAVDDGYRGVHAYFQVDNNHYPIEIQYNTYYDRQFNNWLHKYIYKKIIAPSIGGSLRKQYEQGTIRSEDDFKEALKDVLSDSKKS